MLLSVPFAACSFLDHETQQEPYFSFPDLEFASWDIHDLVVEPVSEPITSESNQTSPNSSESNHGSFHSTEPVKLELELELNERKLKRMKSNRESARRSRVRKQKHLDNLRNEASRLNYTNREISNQLRFFQHIGLRFRSENQMLRTEHSMLRQRLIELQNMMIFRQIQQMNNHKNTRMNEPMGI